MVVAALGCHGYQICEPVLDKTAELLATKGVSYIFSFEYDQVVGYIVVEELRKELREKQMDLNSIKLDTNLFKGSFGNVCVCQISC